MKKKTFKTKAGFTIIETMISISLFIIIVMAGMGALLNANLLHQKSRDMRSIMDNLSFVMEDMSRNLRTGYEYKCYISYDPNNLVMTSTTPPQDCVGGSAIGFKPQGYNSNSIDNDKQWMYEIVGQSGSYYIRKSTDNGSSWVQLTPEEVHIDGVASSFTVLGSALGAPLQPFVTIKLKGTITYKNVATPFSLQTSVSQRLLDN